MTTVTDSQRYSNWINQKTQPTSMWRLEGGGIATYLPKGCHWTIFLAGGSLWLHNPFKPAVERSTTLGAGSFRPVPSCSLLLFLWLALIILFWARPQDEVGDSDGFMVTTGAQSAFGDWGICSDHSRKRTRICISTLEGRKYGNNGASGTLIL